MTYVLIVLMVAYLALIVCSGIAVYRTHRGVLVTEGERLTIYRQGIKSSWAAAVLIGGVALLADLSFDSDLGLGFRFFHFDVSPVFTISVLIAAGAFFVYMAVQLGRLATDHGAQNKAWRRIGGGTSRDTILSDVGENLLIPRSRREKSLFTLLSLTAAVCEEITMRGVLFAVIQIALPVLPLYVVPLIAGVLFGVAHSYQGALGVLKTGLVGIGFGYLYLACGSIIPGIVLHFIVDFTNRFIVPDDLP
jgi:membrane protease YdiL (CAAX protease family)